MSKLAELIEADAQRDVVASVGPINEADLKPPPYVNVIVPPIDSTGLLCDLCEAYAAIVEYPMKPHAVGGTTHDGLDIVIPLTEPWKACEPCHRLIESHDYERLARRAYRTLHDELRQSYTSHAMEIIRRAQASFVRHRDGEARPIARAN
jgi:hypothetical protein